MKSTRLPEACPPALPPATKKSWAQLGISTKTMKVFNPEMVNELPEPVARWLRHSIAPGTPILTGVQVSMHGKIRIKVWMPFVADQIVGPTGYIWAAQAGRFPIKFSGYDRYSDTTGQMEWKLFGKIPLVTTEGLDVSRSAAGRLASELVGLTPGGALAENVSWDALDDHHAMAAITVDGLTHNVTITVGDDGALKNISLPRWANPDNELFGMHTFGVICDGEFTTAGYTLPRYLRAGWWPDTPEWEKGEFFRAYLDHARFF
jgi:hypothetical protein